MSQEKGMEGDHSLCVGVQEEGQVVGVLHLIVVLVCRCQVCVALGTLVCLWTRKRNWLALTTPLQLALSYSQSVGQKEVLDRLLQFILLQQPAHNLKSIMKQQQCECQLQNIIMTLNSLYCT